MTRAFRSTGAAVVVLGDNHGELGGSEYLARLHGVVAGEPPALDLGRERALQQLVVGLVRAGLVESAHDCAEGGVAIALAECTFDTGGIGVTAAVEGGGGPRGAGAVCGRGGAVRRERVADHRVGAGGLGRRECWSGLGPRACRPRSSAAPAATTSASTMPARRRSGCGWMTRRPAGRARSDGTTSGRRARLEDGRPGRFPRGRLSEDSHDVRQVPGRMRRLRHLRASRGGQHGLPRALRAPASRPGKRRHRRVERRAGAPAAVDGLRGRDLHPGRAGDAARARRHRPHPLLHGGRELGGQRAAAAHRLRARPGRHLPQRQHRQRPRAARRAGAGRVDLPDQQRHRGGAAPVRAVQGRRRSKTRSSRRLPSSPAPSRSRC